MISASEDPLLTYDEERALPGVDGPLRSVVRMLTRHERNGIAFWRDDELLASAGITVAFSERGGGVSAVPYASLDLATHVGDDPAAVDANRTRLLDVLGLGGMRAQLTCAEQVHGSRVREVAAELVGAGAYAADPVRGPVPGTDGLVTGLSGVPLMLMFADCVPVVLVRPRARRIAVMHAGWRGALAGIAGIAARSLGSEPGTDDVLAYIGPHIGSCCYEVSPSLVSLFRSGFATLGECADHLDLGAVVAEDLVRAGVPIGRQTAQGSCTADDVGAFFSYRAENGRTGRHCAIAAIAGASC